MAIMQYTHNDVVPFSPLDYTPLAWYDSSDVSTITKDISDRVSEWRDKSGLGYHLAQSVDLNKPVYNSSNGIVFDGINDYLTKSFGVTYNQPLTYIIVYKIESQIASYGVLVDGINSTNRNAYYYGQNWVNMYAGANQIHYDKLLPFSNYVIGEAQFNGALSNAYENGIQKITNQNSGNYPLTGVIIGSDYNFGNQLKGYIKEILIYNSVLTTNQRANINNYLNTKYSIY